MIALHAVLLGALVALSLPGSAAGTGPAPAAPPAPTPAPTRAPAPASAKQLLEEARTTASASGRGVLVGFHASWCGYCRKLEGLLAQPPAKEILDRRFVVTWLTVLEKPGKEGLENPGGRALYEEWSGNEGGLPFLATLDSSGRLTATSLRPGRDGVPRNIGLPVRPPEVAHFVAMLRSASPALTDAEAVALTDAFTKAK